MKKELDDIVVTLPSATRNMYVDGEFEDRAFSKNPESHIVGSIRQVQSLRRIDIYL